MNQNIETFPQACTKEHPISKVPDQLGCLAAEAPSKASRFNTTNFASSLPEVVDLDAVNEDEEIPVSRWETKLKNLLQMHIDAALEKLHIGS